MNSGVKGIIHTVLSIVSLYLPTLITGNPYASLTIGAVIASLLNWALSKTVPTTSGASTRQNATL